MTLYELLAIDLPIVQAPMAGISTPALAAVRAALFSEAAHHTTVTRAISGRPARCLANRFTTLGAHVPAAEIPAYPIAYDAGKALHAAAKSAAEYGYGAQWAGQGAPLARALPAAALIATLAAELATALASSAD